MGGGGASKREAIGVLVQYGGIWELDGDTGLMVRYLWMENRRAKDAEALSKLR